MRFDSAKTAEAVFGLIMRRMIKDYKIMFDRFETMDQPSFFFRHCGARLSRL